MGGSRYDYVAGMVAAFNAVRSQSGAGAVNQAGSLNAAVEAYATLHYTQYGTTPLDHGLDGGPGDRAQRYGFFGSIGEILAAGNGTPEYFVQLWMASPPHRDIILDGKYTVVGVSCYQGPSSSDVMLCAAMFGG